MAGLDWFFIAKLLDKLIDIIGKNTKQTDNTRHATVQAQALIMGFLLEFLIDYVL